MSANSSNGNPLNHFVKSFGSDQKSRLSDNFIQKGGLYTGPNPANVPMKNEIGSPLKKPSTELARFEQTLQGHMSAADSPLKRPQGMYPANSRIVGGVLSAQRLAEPRDGLN